MRWISRVTEDPDGAGVAGQPVRLRRISDGATLATATTDADGWVDVTHPGNPGRVALEAVGTVYRGQDSGVHGPVGAVAGEDACAALAALGGGVLAGQAGGLRVTPGGVLGGRSVTVSAGRALTSRGRPFVLYAPYAVAVPPSQQGSLGRIDRLVIRDDHGEEGRAEIVLVAGDEAFFETPQAPAAGANDVTLALVSSSPSKPALTAADVDDTARDWAGQGVLMGAPSIAATASSSEPHTPTSTTYAGWDGVSASVTLAAGVEYDVSAEADLIGEGTVAARVLIGGDAGGEVAGASGAVRPLAPRHARTLTGDGNPVPVAVQARAVADPTATYQLERSWASSAPQGVELGLHSDLFVCDAFGLWRYALGGTLVDGLAGSGLLDAAISGYGHVLTTSAVGGGTAARRYGGGYGEIASVGAAGFGVASYPTGYVYLANGSAISRFTISSNGMFGGYSSYPGRATEARGIALGPGNRVYVADHGSNVVRVFDANMNPLWAFSGGLSGPWDLTFDQAGYLYVTEAGANRVSVFNWDGSFRMDLFGSGVLNSPRGIAVDSSGDVYVADSGNNRIAVFSKQTPVQRLRGGTLLVTAVPRG